MGGLQTSETIKAFIGAGETEVSPDEGLQERRSTLGLGSSSISKRKFSLRGFKSFRARTAPSSEGLGIGKRWSWDASAESASISVDVTVEKCMEDNLARGFHSLTGALQSRSLNPSHIRLQCSWEAL